MHKPLCKFCWDSVNICILGFIGSRNLSINFGYVKALFQEGIDRIGTKVWNNCVLHVIDNEKAYWKTYIAVECEVE